MTDQLILIVAAALLAVRLSALRRFWRLPWKNGDEIFLAARVPAGFHRGAGAGVLRRYHLALLAPFAFDVPLGVVLLVSGRPLAAMYEQFIALLLTSIVNNAVVAHFSYRAGALAGGCAARPTSVHLSMEPRRLRDHTWWWVETVIALCLASSAVVVARGSSSPAAALDRSIAPPVAWLLYLQLGLLLLKRVFVGWRMPLPARRTEDFKRWRTAWLAYHLRVFDGVRIFIAVMLLAALAVAKDHVRWGSTEAIAGAVLLGIGFVAFIVFAQRERLRLAAVEREVRPLELANEFPARPIAEGRFLAGGLLCFLRDQPSVVVRSAQGIALNLAQPTTYVWAGYFAGLVALAVWQVAW
jgi:hypothetical protein